MIIKEVLYDLIKENKKLNINEAKELLLKAKETENKEKQKKYLNEVVLGTLYFLYDHLDANVLNILAETDYDIEDIISSFTEEWIKNIYNYSLLNVDRFSRLFTKNFYTNLVSNLCGNAYPIGDFTCITSDVFSKIFIDYMQLRNNNHVVSFNDFKELLNKNKIVRDYFHENEAKNLYVLFNNIYASIKKDELGECNVTETRFDFLKQLLINNALEEGLNDNVSYEIDFIHRVNIEQMHDALNQSRLSKKEKELIMDRYGLNDGKAKSLEEVGKNFSVTRERVRQVEAKAFRKLRLSNSLKEYI